MNQLLHLSPKNSQARASSHTDPLSCGKIISVRGNGVDVWFGHDLPSIHSVLYAGNDRDVTIEVLTQLDKHSVRGIALNPTQGLARGMRIETERKQLSVPVGKAIIGRMFDVFGNTIDHGPPLPDMPRRSIHQLPPPLSKRSTKSEIFLTGIKAIDVLIPLERGGKAGT